jgi:FKBP-type peptidyl-prolyl cis-trans isomerase 2
MTIESGDRITFEYTGRLDDGTVFDTSRRSVAEEHGLTEDENQSFEALSVEVGTGQLIEGLDEALLGMAEGESQTVTVPPEAGYGEWTEDRVREYETEALSDQLGEAIPESGTYMQTPDGGVAEILSVEADVVRMDFNHRLAGETLEFDVEILDVN